jgi:hypothetical protein
MAPKEVAAMKRILLSIPTLLALAAFAIAQPAPPPPDNPDGPAADAPDGQYETGRAVARISVLNGDVSVRRGDSGDVVAATINAPVMGGDAILTSSSARGEVQLDYANMLRFSPNSEVRFAGLDVKSFQIQIASGTVTLRVLRQGQAQVELDTPSVAVRPARQGVYRITVREDGTSEITVRSGDAEIGSPRGTERLGPGRTMNARGAASDPEFQVTAAIPYDNWDRWNEDRDRYLESSHSYDHVSHDIYGAEDLDQNGRWVNDPNYGSVWAPNVAAGWAPYQNGRWVWEDYYGWTWVSYDPWGWAPYHYGRWFFGPVGWCWYPGGIYARHFWAPAYVGFVGWGGGFGVGFGFGNVGWVALAPFEVFHPWWGRGFYGGYRSGFFGNRTTIVNNINITNVYRNAGVTGGISGVNAGQFGRAGGRFTSFNGNQIQGAGVVRGALPLAPDRNSLRTSDRAAAGNFRQSSVQNFAGHAQATNVSRVPFAQQQQSMQQLSRSSFNVPNRGGVNSPGGSPSGAIGSAPATHGWGRFGEPIHGSGSNGSGSNGAVAPQQGQNLGRSVQGSTGGAPSNGWGRFENTRPGASANPSAPANNNFSQGRRSFADGGGGGGAVRISPPMVRERAPSFQAPSYQAPRNYSAPSYQAPRNSGGGGRSAPSFNGGGAGNRGGGGGGARTSGGGGGHGGGGGRR